jgi:hypothetical protein
VANQTNQGAAGPGKSARFEALLEKLVRIQTDLAPTCGAGGESAQVVATVDSIAEACEVLRSAIADVRYIIYETNALMDRPEALYGD